jgi:RimJ/RimL family protein N-acetyltransferase
VQNPFLIGTAVYLRPLEREDAPTLTRWMNDPEVTRFLRGRGPINQIAEEEFLRSISDSTTDLVVGIVVRETERFIGATGLHHIDHRNRHGMFGITLGETAEWGKGYGTEVTRLIVRHAFETLNLNRVWLHVYEFNPRAVHTYEKVGFMHEGRLRQDTFRGGRYWDTLVMAILREDWKG